MTTGEVVEGLRVEGIPEDAVEAFGRFASRCDLVKFAKLRPTPDACQDSLDAARAFVDQTRPHDDHLFGGEGSGGGAGTDESDQAGDAEIWNPDDVEDPQDTEDDDAHAPARAPAGAPARTPAHTEGG